MSDTTTPQPTAMTGAEAPVAAPQPAPAAPAAKGNFYWGTGRRKSSVARVRLLPGDGKFLVNDRPVEKYFAKQVDRVTAMSPLTLTNTLGQWNVLISVAGGGSTGQAGAVRLGIARALLKAGNQHEAVLRGAGYLTRDAREVERKKYGQRKARRRFQFSKR